jgi:hypothetical protein
VESTADVPVGVSNVSVIENELAGLSQSRHGTYCVRRRVPKDLKRRSPSVMARSASRRSNALGTKELKRANVLVKSAFITFDHTFARAFVKRAGYPSPAVNLRRPTRTAPPMLRQFIKIRSVACFVALPRQVQFYCVVKMRPTPAARLTRIRNRRTHTLTAHRP